MIPGTAATTPATDAAANTAAPGTAAATPAAASSAGPDAAATTDIAAISAGPGAAASSAGLSAVLELAPIDEPAGLLDDLRLLSAERPALARSEAPKRLAAVAIAAWHDRLVQSGISSAVIGPAFEGARREIWLWVEGDRNWSQLAPHLAGRVVRRRPALGD